MRELTGSLTLVLSTLRRVTATRTSRRMTCLLLVPVLLFATVADRSAATAAEIGRDDSFMTPQAYRISATYSPQSSTLSVECTIDLEFSEAGRLSQQDGLPYARFGVSDRFVLGKCESAEGDIRIRWGGSGSYRVVEVYQATGASADGTDQGSTWPKYDQVTLRYSGTPWAEGFGGVWSGATVDALWLTSPLAWLPFTDALTGQSDEEYWTGTDFDLSLEVPTGWRVIVPGLEPVTVDSHGGTDRFEFSYRSHHPGQTRCPIRLVAGPYESFGSGEARGVNYTMLGLPPWQREAETMAAHIPGIVEHHLEMIGGRPGASLTLFQVPPQFPGGICFGLTGVILISARPKGGEPRITLAHEIAHFLAPFFDEGLVQLLAYEYLRTVDPPAFALYFSNKRLELLRAIEKHGDMALTDIMAVHSGELPEPVAYAYTKPAIVWLMFQSVFGREKTLDVIRALESPASTEQCGSSGAEFYDRWFTQAAPLDFALEAATYRLCEPDEEEGRGHGYLLTITLRDNYDDHLPAGRHTIPTVDVGVQLENPEGTRVSEIHRIALTGDVTTTTVFCGGRPLGVTLAPSYLLDYNPDNDYIKAKPESRSRSVLWAFASSLLALIIIGVLWLIISRRPARVPPPPVPHAPRDGAFPK